MESLRRAATRVLALQYLNRFTEAQDSQFRRATLPRQHLGAVQGPCLLCETRVAELQRRAEQAWASGVRH